MYQEVDKVLTLSLYHQKDPPSLFQLPTYIFKYYGIKLSTQKFSHKNKEIDDPSILI